jgi:DNA-3-methyladenine glycosylase II
LYFQYGQIEIEYLKNRDKTLGAVIDRIGHIQRPINTDLFSSIVSNIIGQQISSTAHRTIMERIDNKIGKITPGSIESLTTNEIQKFGMTFKKAENIRNISLKIKNGELDIKEMKKKNDEDLIAELIKLKGIGQWTADMIMIFCLQRKNILSYNDLAIHRGLRILYHQKSISKELFEKYRKRYDPYNTVASLYLWAIAAG